jgi:hypothetical protein
LDENDANSDLGSFSMNLEWNGDGEAPAGGEAGLTMGVRHLEPHDIFHFSWGAALSFVL